MSDIIKLRINDAVKTEIYLQFDHKIVLRVQRYSKCDKAFKLLNISCAYIRSVVLLPVFTKY